MLHSFNSNLKIKRSIPKQLKQWLDHDLPITSKLNALTGDAHLNLLFQGWLPSDWWSASMAQINEPCFQRNIVMSSHGANYWYARSIIPQSCYQLENKFFNRLENESIRNLIYNEPKVRMLRRLIYPINEACLEWYWVTQFITSNTTLWVRVKEYSFLDFGVFYLIEVFFPNLLDISV